MKHPQGEKILEEMVEKVTAVFDKNIQALKVRGFENTHVNVEMHLSD